jgi:hypothetical protein
MNYEVQCARGELNPSDLQKLIDKIGKEPVSVSGTPWREARWRCRDEAEMELLYRLLHFDGYKAGFAMIAGNREDQSILSNRNRLGESTAHFDGED